jgi:tetratricopeptide (TPR) repeat protein
VILNKTNAILAVVGLIASLLSTTIASAENTTFTKEYTYMASDIDSKVSSRAIALEQVKRALLEQLGTYLISETEINNYHLTKDQITTLTAGIVSTEVIDERRDGRTYYLKAKIAADPKEVAKSINAVRTDVQKSKDLENSKNKAEEAMREIERLKKELKLVKGNTTIQREYTNAIKYLSATDWFDKGEAFLQSNNLHAAIDAYDKAIELNPQFVEAYNNRGVAYGKLGSHQQAFDDFNKAIELNPINSMGYFNRGTAYGELGNPQQAINDFNKAIELNPRFVEAYNNRGAAYGKLGNYQQAITDHNKALELNPTSAEAYNNRGRDYGALGNHQQALNDFNKGIELNPKDAWAYTSRGYAYYKLGNNQQAISDYNKAIELNPKDAGTYYNRGNVYFNLGNHRQAISDFNKTIELSPMQSAAVTYNMACLYSINSNGAEACKWLRTSVEKGYNDWKHIKEDNDLDNIRNSSCYKEIMKGK